MKYLQGHTHKEYGAILAGRHPLPDNMEFGPLCKHNHGYQGKGLYTILHRKRNGCAFCRQIASREKSHRQRLKEESKIQGQHKMIAIDHKREEYRALAVDEDIYGF